MQRKQKKLLWLTALIFLVLAVVSGFLMGRVKINYSLSDYLDEESSTKNALDIVNEEFGMVTDIKVMVSDIEKDAAEALYARLGDIDGVLFASFDSSSEKNYKDNTALFTVMAKGDEYSANANAVFKEVKAVVEEEYGDRAVFGGAVASTNQLKNTITGEMGYILLISVLLVVAILLLTARSWLEPFVLLLASGVAILINLGTNVLFGDISYITNSVAAILQLALSIDYSIALLHSYRKMREESGGGYGTMVTAVKSVAKPIAASALTTIAGLFALLFMSFGIGVDLGTVLIKGVFISFITSLTLFPVLILLFEKAMDKTHKKGISFSGKKLCGFAKKASRIVIPLFLVIVVLCLFVKNGLDYSFTTNLGAPSPITQKFGHNNSVVLVYENSEDGISKEKELFARLSHLKNAKGNPAVLSYTGYSNTAGQDFSADDAVQLLGVSKSDANVLFAYLGVLEDKELLKLSTADFILFANKLVVEDERVGAMVDDKMKSGVAFVAGLLEKDKYLQQQLGTPVDYIKQSDILYKQSMGLLAEPPSTQLTAGVYAMYMAQHKAELIPNATAKALLDFAVEQQSGGLLASYVDEEKMAMIAQAQDYLSVAEGMFVGEKHSMLLLSLDLPAEGEATDAFTETALKDSKALFGKAYLAGVIPTTYDLKNSFSYDNTLITVLTIISVFVIVTLIFRSLSLPLILVTIIQGAIWFAMSVMCLWGRSEFFMSYIMSNCILMGATIDYGILMSNNYLSARKNKDVPPSLESAVETALPTVFTSGLTMIIAGFVIFFISSQNAIADTGLIIGVGTLASCGFITLVLPSILYRLDGFIMKLTRQKRNNC